MQEKALLIVKSLIRVKTRLMELLNNIISTLKVQNHNNHPTETSSFKTTSFKKSRQQRHDQFVAGLINKTNGYVAFTCKRFYIDNASKRFYI